MFVISAVDTRKGVVFLNRGGTREIPDPDATYNVPADWRTGQDTEFTPLVG